MIYTVITNIEKMDCRLLRQSKDFISDNLADYIEKTTNLTLKKARLCAYSSLFFALREIFSVKNADICFSTDGKPYLINCENKIYISISHSESLSVVCLSDEGEIGVDVQESIDTKRSQRIEKRFFSGLETNSSPQKNNENLSNIQAHNNPKQKNNILVFGLYDGKLTLTNYIDEHLSFIETKGDYTEKWTLAESLLKCEGVGFGGASNVSQIQENCQYTTMRILADNKEYALSISIKKTIM